MFTQHQQSLIVYLLSRATRWRYLCFRGLYEHLMIVSIDRALVIFAEKVTFWDQHSHVAYQSNRFGSFLEHFGPDRAKYILGRHEGGS